MFFPDLSEERGVQKTCSLLDYVLDCLHKCFMYDTDGFLDNDRFQCLMQPLVDQVLLVDAWLCVTLKWLSDESPHKSTLSRKCNL